MKWDSTDEKGKRTLSVTDWFNVEDYKKKLRPKAGVYIFADDQEDAKYIGKAGNGRMVVESEDTVEKLFEVYSAIYRNKDLNATQAKVIYTHSDNDAKSLERDLIKKYDPPNNGIDLLKS